jgi:Icc-related predicted phosphoesterase
MGNFRAVKQIWNDDIVQVRTSQDGAKIVAIGCKDDAPYIFQVADHEDLNVVKMHLLNWLRSHIVDCGGAGPTLMSSND